VEIAGGSAGCAVDIDSISSMGFRPKVPTTTAFFGVKDAGDALE